MIEWFTPQDKLPEDQQECLLMPRDEGGMITVGVFGPIMWNAKLEAWIDIFRDPEAGTMIAKDRVGRWTAWDPIKPPEEEE